MLQLKKSHEVNSMIIENPNQNIDKMTDEILENCKKFPISSQLMFKCYQLMLYISTNDNDDQIVLENIKKYTEHIVRGYEFLAPEDKIFNEEMLFHIENDSWQHCTNHIVTYLIKISERP